MQEPLKSPWQCSYLKNLKSHFWGNFWNSCHWVTFMGLKTPPQNFFENTSTNRAARGFQCFGLIEGAAGILSEQWPKFWCQISAVIRWKCWKFQWDISNCFWIIMDLLKNSGHHPPTLSKFLLKEGRFIAGRHLGRWWPKYFGKSMITQKLFEISL